MHNYGHLWKNGYLAKLLDFFKKWYLAENEGFFLRCNQCMKLLVLQGNRSNKKPHANGIYSNK